MNPEDFPTMEELAQRYFRLLGEKVANDDTFMSKVEQVRSASKISGINEFNYDHLIGGLFVTSALQSGIKILHTVQLIDHDCMEKVLTLLNEQALISTALSIGTP